MRVSVIGVGPGSPDLLTEQANDAIARADCLIGARRVLAATASPEKKQLCASSSAEVTAALETLEDAEHAAVLVSGDVGFYSLAKGMNALPPRYEIEYLCGVSSLQYFCAKLKMPWEDVRLVSLHGRRQKLLAAVMTCRRSFVLTGGHNTVEEICARLCEAGLAEVLVWAGENLSYPDERIRHGTARELAGETFAQLSVMLVQNDQARLPAVDFGLPDDRFIRGDTPMTKSEIRAASLSALRLRPGDLVWDVGAGTGSVSVELARLLPGGSVYAVERDAQALSLIRQNREKFAVHQLEIVSGEAPAILRELPAPDRVFIGGASGCLPEVVEIALEKNPAARIVVTAITLETLQQTLACFAARELAGTELVQLTAARAVKRGNSHLMLGQNPVYIISGGGAADD